jgi:hypothetical protein
MSAETPLMTLFRRVHRATCEVERLKLDLSRGDDIDSLLKLISKELHKIDPPDLLRRQRLKQLRRGLRLICRLAFTPDEQCWPSESLPSLEMIVGAAIACLRRTSTLDDVRSYEPALRTPATLYLLDEIFREKVDCLPSHRARQFEFLIEGCEIYVGDYEIDNGRSLVSDKSLRNVHSKEEFFRWFLERKIGAELLNPGEFSAVTWFFTRTASQVRGDSPSVPRERELTPLRC